MSRRRQAFVKDNRAPVPSGAGVGAAAVTPPPSPVSREEEEKAGIIWSKPEVKTFTYVGPEIMTPATDPVSNAPKKRGWPKGKKRKP